MAYKSNEKSVFHMDPVTNKCLPENTLSFVRWTDNNEESTTLWTVEELSSRLLRVDRFRQSGEFQQRPSFPPASALS